MLKSVAWTVGFRMLDRAAGVVSMLLLARMLLPEHFGIVALATSVLAFVELLGALGLDTILIQKKDPTREHFDTAWTIQLGIATICGAILAVAAIPASWFFKEPRVAPIIFMLAGATFVDGLQNIRIVEFRKQMRFDREFVYMAIRRLSGIAVTLTLAVILRNEWALAIGILSGKTIGVMVGYWMRPYVPRLTLVARGELLAKSWWLFLANLVQFVRARSSDILLGRVAGTAAVGAYSLGSEMATTVSSELVAPINRVALPEFSSIGTREGVLSRVDQVTGLVAVFLTPASFGLAACAGPVVEVFFGARWAATSQVLQILALSGWLSALGSNLGMALLALGHYTANAAVHAAGAAILVPLIILGAFVAGPEGVAVATLAANVLTVGIGIGTAHKLTGYSPLGFLRQCWRPTLAALSMYAIVKWVLMYTANLHGAVHLVVAVATGTVLYPAALLLLWTMSGRPDSAERTAMTLAAKVLRRLRPRSSVASLAP
jgi:lipopolysaccharide exporter